MDIFFCEYQTLWHHLVSRYVGEQICKMLGSPSLLTRWTGRDGNMIADSGGGALEIVSLGVVMLLSSRCLGRQQPDAVPVNRHRWGCFTLLVPRIAHLHFFCIIDDGKRIGG